MNLRICHVTEVITLRISLRGPNELVLGGQNWEGDPFDVASTDREQQMSWISHKSHSVWKLGSTLSVSFSFPHQLAPPGCSMGGTKNSQIPPKHSRHRHLRCCLQNKAELQPPSCTLAPRAKHQTLKSPYAAFILCCPEGRRGSRSGAIRILGQA